MNKGNKNLAVIGLGLIGTSILHAIKLKFDNEFVTYAYDLNLKHRQIVENLNIADYVVNDIKKAVEKADIVILAVPVGVMGNVAKEVCIYLKKGTILTDTGSTKVSVINDIKKHISSDVYFIPSHPLAGTEHSGPKSGFATLFENRYWIIVSSVKNDKTLILENIFSKFGAIIEYMDADYHDKALAITSHLPHLIAFTIVGTASNLELDLKNDIIRYAATGFRDFTRLASSDPTMWRDIFLNNNEAILEILDRFNKDLLELKKYIKQKNKKELFDFFSKTRRIRSKIVKVGQHEYEDFKKI